MYQPKMQEAKKKVETSQSRNINIKICCRRESELEDNLLPILTTRFRQNPRLMEQAVDTAAIQLFERLSAEEMEDVKDSSRFTNSELCMICTF